MTPSNTNDDASRSEAWTDDHGRLVRIAGDAITTELACDVTQGRDLRLGLVRQ